MVSRSRARRASDIRILEEELGVDARARGNEVRLVGPSQEVDVARKVLEVKSPLEVSFAAWPACRRG